MSVDRRTIWPYVDGDPAEYYYGRYGNPVSTEAERRLGELDGGHALVFPSGSGATVALVLGLLGSGDTVALAHDAYFGTSVLLRALERWGLRLVEFDQTGPPPPDVQLVWLEPCSNPLLSFPDLTASIETAHAQGAQVVVDSTVLTPVLLRPLDHGADLVLHSATKYLVGHDDALLGVVTAADPATAERLRGFRSVSGIVAAPDPLSLLLRGLETLTLRVERQAASALELARRLREHPRVERVRYPGLGDPVAARYVEAFGGLLSFEVEGGPDAARRVETSTRLITNATSLGSVNSLIETRARWEGERVPGSLVRLSVGLESPDELWRDLLDALEHA